MLFTDIFNYLKIYRKYLGTRLYIVFVLTVLTAAAEGLGITLLLPLIEAADTAGGDYDSPVTSAINAILGFLGIAGSMGGILVFIAIVFLSKGLLKFSEGAYKGYLQAQLLRELKARMFDAYSTMDYRYYIKRNTGHFINVINTQIQLTLMAFEKLLSFLTQSIMAISYLAIAFFIVWNFALMAVGAGFILLLFFKRLNVYVKNISRKTAKEASNLNKFLVQTLQAFKYIASTAQTGHLREGVVKSVDLLAGYKFKQKIASAFTESMKEPVSVIFMIFIVAIQVIFLNAAIGPIVVALLLFYRAMRATIGVQEGWQATMNQIGSLEMVEDEFRATRESQEPDGDAEIGPLQNDIRFENVYFSYDANGESVIKDAAFTIPVNHTVALAGESGAGKTTLVDMITLMLPPASGEIYIDGIPGSRIKRHSWRRQIGYVSQEAVVFDDTIANNICLWQGDYKKDPEIRERIEEAARKAYADIFINEMHDGFETVVGDRGVRLSGGQKQRLFIARELFKNPNLLLLDEATSALDSQSERYIQRGIDELKGTLTVVIIAHRLSTIKNADLIYVMHKGRIVESGTFHELTANNGTRFSKMVDIQKV